MYRDLISVVVPIYNMEKYVKICIESILVQTYENLEIILVDDGSTDRCPEICDEYALADKRIRVVHKKNGGLSDARNAGIVIATGKFITFVDSDDLILPEMIVKLYELCHHYHADFTMCQYLLCAENDTYESISAKDEKIHIEVFKKTEKMKAYLASRKIETVVWGKMYSIKLFETLRFPKGKLHEDAFMMPILVDKADTIVITSEVGYVYRIRAQSIMRSGFSMKRLHSIEAKLEQLKYIESNYPEQRFYACVDVVYACNFCLKEMVLKEYYEQGTERKIQTLYRKYACQYLKAEKVSVQGKIVALFAFVDTRLARAIMRLAFQGIRNITLIKRFGRRSIIDV